MRPTVLKQPKGTCLVISPFNFPIFLSIGHLVRTGSLICPRFCLTLTTFPKAGAIAAGNTAVLKPSELTPATAALMAELFPQYLDESCYRLVNGDVPVVTKVRGAV